MSGAPPPYPPPFPPGGDWKYQRRIMRDQMRAQRDLSREQWKFYREQQQSIRRSRGGSVLGPLLLVLSGVFFLLLRAGKLNWLQVGAWYGRWWPLLLITGGIVLLAEWAFTRSRPVNPLIDPRPRVGGGVIVLLFLLCLPGIGFNLSHGPMQWMGESFSGGEGGMEQLFGDKHESDQVLDQALPSGTALVVTNPRGDITITGGSDDGTIHISVHKEVFDRSSSDATAKADRLVPQLSFTGGVATLGLPVVENAHADVTIALPTTTPLTITADRGSVHLSSMKSPVRVTANHGDLEVNAIGGTVTAHMNHRGSSFNARGVRGDLTLEGDCHDVDISNVTGSVALDGDFFGRTHFERLGGGVRFHTSRTDFQVTRLDGEVNITRGDLSADQIVGPVALTARSYNVTLDRVAGDVSVTTSDGSVDLTSAPPLGNITIQNRNGAVNLTVPEQAGFSVDAETRDGDVETDLPLTKTEDRHNNRMTGTVGNGGALIRVNTSQNDISLKKGAIAPLAPPTPALPQVTLAPPSVPKVPAGSTHAPSRSSP